MIKTDKGVKLTKEETSELMKTGYVVDEDEIKKTPIYKVTELILT